MAEGEDEEKGEQGRQKTLRSGGEKAEGGAGGRSEYRRRQRGKVGGPVKASRREGTTRERKKAREWRDAVVDRLDDRGEQPHKRHGAKGRET